MPRREGEVFLFGTAMSVSGRKAERPRKPGNARSKFIKVAPYTDAFAEWLVPKRCGLTHWPVAKGACRCLCPPRMLGRVAGHAAARDVSPSGRPRTARWPPCEPEAAPPGRDAARSDDRDCGGTDSAE